MSGMPQAWTSRSTRPCSAAGKRSSGDLGADQGEGAGVDRVRIAQIVGHGRAAQPRRAVGALARPWVRMVVIVPMLVVMMAVVVMVMMAAVGADALDMVVVALLRRAQVALEAEHLGAVLAQAAVHVDVAGADAADALDEGLDHQRMVVEIVGLAGTRSPDGVRPRHRPPRRSGAPARR